jgi:hypothetical protein
LGNTFLIRNSRYHHCINISVKVGDSSPSASISGAYPDFQLTFTQAIRVKLHMVRETKSAPDCVFSQYRWKILDQPPTSLSALGAACLEEPTCNVIIQKAGKYTFLLEATNIEKKITRFSFSVDVIQLP